MRRRNQKPVFVTGLGRSGSNLLLNLLRSHPDLCSPRGELQEVLKGKSGEPFRSQLTKRLRYLPIYLAEGYDVFASDRWVPRHPLKAVSARLLDRILYHDKRRALAPDQNLYKSEGVPYTAREIAAARLVCKCLDGLIFVVPLLARVFPDACFIGLVRNGLAICESHARRGNVSLELTAERYEQGCLEMLSQAEKLPNYRILRYEELVTETRKTVVELYEQIGVDPEKPTRVRLEAKPVLNADGRHAPPGGESPKSLLWYGLDEMERHMVKEANQIQIDRLTEKQQAFLRERCRRSLEGLGYL